MLNKSTMPEMWHPLMHFPSIKPGYCAICGRHSPLELHHIVPRSAGEYAPDGQPLEKPTIQLCGFGNNLRDADGLYYCHGKAHHKLLHFRVHGIYLEYLDLTAQGYTEGVDYLTALNMDGWEVLPYYLFLD